MRKIKKGEVVALSLKDFNGINAYYRVWAKRPSIMVVTSRQTSAQLKKNVPVLRKGEVFFIDCIGNEASDDCVVMPGPVALTSISLAVESALKEGEVDFLIIDSPSSFLVYNGADHLIRFLKDISQKAAKKKVAVVLPLLERDSEGVLSSLKMHVDRIEYS